MTMTSAIAWLTWTLIGVCAPAWDARAAAVTPTVQPDQPSKPDVMSAAAIPIQRAPEDNVEKWLRISNLRIEDAFPSEEKPSAVLKFHTLNRGTTTITDIVFAISIVRKPRGGQADDRPRLLAGPFTIWGNVVLEPGYTADYEMLLRNVSPDCRCTATVAIVSARSVPDSQR